MTYRMKMTVAAAALCLAIFGAVAAAEEMKAELAGIQGRVQMQTLSDTDWRAASDGAVLSRGAMVSTGPGAEVTVKWGGNQAVKVYELSRIKIESLMADSDGTTESEVALEQGRLMAKVGKLKTKDSSFAVRTPVALAGVRGTTFDCALDTTGSQMTVSVLEGDVFVAVGDIETLVTSGFETMINVGDTPQPPVAIPETKLEDLKSDSASLERTVDEEPASSEAAPAEEEEEPEEEMSAEEEAPAEEAPAGETVSVEDQVEQQTEQVADTVLDNTIEDATIQADITDTAEAVIRECVSCITGTVEF